MSEFSDRPFVAGSVIGLRAFRIDALGRLTGVTHKDVWVPGENVAQCHKSDTPVYYGSGSFAAGGYITQMGQMFYSGPGLSPSRYITPIAAEPESIASKVAKKFKKDHRSAGVRCECGFYAYFDGGNDYLSDQWARYGLPTSDDAPRVGAIVEGWGTCTVGTRGFRAEKAKVLALIKPKGDDARREVAFTRMQRNYPDVAVFATERDAIAEFPLSDPIAATPDDEDFWTRSAS